MLAFFPWLRLQEHPTVGPYELVPYSRGEQPAGEGTSEQATLDSILEPYVSSRAEPSGRATLLRCDGGELTAELTKEQRQRMFEFSEVVAFAGLAAREYFRHTYWNRDHFRFVIQGFRDPAGGAAILTRRRDGSTQSYWPREHYLVTRPIHVSTGTVSLDHAFLEALIGLRDAEDWTRYREAIETFNLANTDSVDLREEVELVLINGAFERLFDLHRGREAELAEAFCAAVAPFSRVAFDHCERLAGRPDRYVEEMANDVPAIRGGFEPEKRRSGKRKTPSFHSEIPRLYGGTNAVRTYFEGEGRGAMPLPTLASAPGPKPQEDETGSTV